jgi:mono/diheme cytochrome c family protein
MLTTMKEEREVAMLRQVALAGAALIAFASVPQVFAQDAKMIERGKQVYAEQKCKMCHSIGAEGNAKGPLDDTGNKLKAAEIREWMVDPKAMTAKTKATRKPFMKAYPNLPAADLDALVAYMQSLKKK